MEILIPDDLDPFAQIERPKAEQMIADAEALAALAAPCITKPEFAEREELIGAVKAILRRAILRWNEAGTGATVQIGAGPFNQTTAQGTNTPRTLFWPSEIEQLRDICAAFNEVGTKGAFSVDTAVAEGSIHRPWCGLHFNASWCSCGADIAGKPLYEEGFGWNLGE